MDITTVDGRIGWLQRDHDGAPSRDFDGLVGNVGINMLLQSLAPEQLRGRVVSFFTSTRFGFDAIGGLLAGLLAARIGAPLTLALEGVVLLVFCVWLLAQRRVLREQVRDDLQEQAAR